MPDPVLKNFHRVALAAIAACALVSALQPWAMPQPALARGAATLAVCLALGSIVARRIASRVGASPGVRRAGTAGAYALAAAIAVFGSGLAVVQQDAQTGLLFALGAGIFCLRPPPDSVRADP